MSHTDQVVGEIFGRASDTVISRGRDLLGRGCLTSITCTTPTERTARALGQSGQHRPTIDLATGRTGCGCRGSGCGRVCSHVLALATAIASSSDPPAGTGCSHGPHGPDSTSCPFCGVELETTQTHTNKGDTT